MSFGDRMTNRLLALFGLNFDLTLDVQRKPLSEITESLFVGRRPRPEDTVALKEAGITHVVSCLPEAERSSVSFLAHNFRCLFVPVHDGIHEQIASAFPVVFEFAENASTQGVDAKLLVHCEVGVSRSATLAIAWVMKSQNKNFLEAFKRVQAGRPQILPNIGFASQLQHLENEIHSDVRQSGELSSLARYLREVCNVPVEVELLQDALVRHDYDAPSAIRAIFGDDIPRVVQGVRL